LVAGAVLVVGLLGVAGDDSLAVGPVDSAAKPCEQVRQFETVGEEWLV
jgi:hypothetical protein